MKINRVLGEGLGLGVGGIVGLIGLQRAQGGFLRDFREFQDVSVDSWGLPCVPGSFIRVEGRSTRVAIGFSEEVQGLSRHFEMLW